MCFLSLQSYNKIFTCANFFVLLQRKLDFLLDNVIFKETFFAVVTSLL